MQFEVNESIETIEIRSQGALLNSRETERVILGSIVAEIEKAGGRFLDALLIEEAQTSISLGRDKRF